MYRRHFSGAKVHRNVECLIQVLPNVLWLDLRKCFISCQRFSMTFMSGLSVKSIANLSTTHKSVTRPKMSNQHKNTRLDPLHYLCHDHRTIQSYSVVTARLLAAWNFSLSFEFMQGVRDANYDSKSLIVVIRYRGGPGVTS